MEAPPQGAAGRVRAGGRGIANFLTIGAGCADRRGEEARPHWDTAATAARDSPVVARSRRCAPDDGRGDYGTDQAPRYSSRIISLLFRSSADVPSNSIRPCTIT